MPAMRSDKSATQKHDEVVAEVDQWLAEIDDELEKNAAVQEGTVDEGA